MRSSTFRLLSLLEVMLFSAFVGWYIWQLQDFYFYSWLVFPVWLIVSFAVHGDTPKTMGWRADNLFSAVRTSTPVLGIFAIALCSIGLLFGATQRPAQYILVPKHFFGYMAFCLLQQVGLNSFLMNRLLGIMDTRLAASLVTGTIFAALHWPNPVLIPLTFIGGAVMALLFARERNILPLAAWQGILGTLVWWAFPLAWHHGMRVGPGFYSFHQR